jgi:hypothetical protein
MRGSDAFAASGFAWCAASTRLPEASAGCERDADDSAAVVVVESMPNQTVRFDNPTQK